MKNKEIKILAMSTDFEHHGEQFGYRQILNFIRPTYLLGLNFREKEKSNNSILVKYSWIFEFFGLPYRNKIDLVHILYGEDYFRWSCRLFNKPIIVTFHQPPSILKKEILYGNAKGRLWGLTHFFNKKRFSKISAAIVLTKPQKQVLKLVMDESKIHVIPHGVYLENSNLCYEQFKPELIKQKEVVTVGGWLRDWKFFFKIVDACPSIHFHIVNKNLEYPMRRRATETKNVTYHGNINNKGLTNLFLSSSLLFLPVKEIAGSNALIQSISLGCPVLVSKVDGDENFQENQPFIRAYKKGDINSCKAILTEIVNLPLKEMELLRNDAFEHAQKFSWQKIAEQTLKIYEQTLANS